MPNSDTIRLKLRTARKPGHDEQSRSVTIHAFCPCTVTGLVEQTYTDLADAQTAALALSSEVAVCKRSKLPTDQADPEPTDAPEIPQETTADPEPTDDAAGPQETTEPVLAGDLVSLVGQLAQPGLSRDEVLGIGGDALGSLIALYADPDADRTCAHTSLTVDNMDNVGKQRRDGLVDLLAALGAVCDAYGVYNDTRSGIYSFTVDVFAPAFAVAALERLAPAIQSAGERHLSLYCATHRAELRAQGLDTKAFNKADADSRRAWMSEFYASLTGAASTLADLYGVSFDLAPHEAAAKESRAARKAASKN